MKRFSYILRYAWSVIFMLLTTAHVNAQTDSILLRSMDSVEIGLLTCGPGEEVYTLYGHTAIRYHDKGRNQDLAINYGMFSFKQKFFILRFVFGLTDYEMGIVPFQSFVNEYHAAGRWIIEQILNLTREEKWAITQAIDENYRPENRVYRYNYFYDNCTTRARNMITDHIQGNVVYAVNTQTPVTYRSMIHQWTASHPWASFGNDLLLGVKADTQTDYNARQFLPDSLMQDFANAIVIDTHGHRRALVDSTFHILYEPDHDGIAHSSLPMPITCALIFLLIVLIVCAIERGTKRVWWPFDVLLMTLDGLAGLILFLMIFSKHPTVSLNFQILALCPLSIFFAYPTIKKLRSKQINPYLIFRSVLLLLFFVLGYWQNYAEGIYIVALSLLIRIAWLHYNCKKINKTTK